MDQPLIKRLGWNADGGWTLWGYEAHEVVQLEATFRRPQGMLEWQLKCRRMLSSDSESGANVNPLILDIHSKEAP